MYRATGKIWTSMLVSALIAVSVSLTMTGEIRWRWVGIWVGVGALIGVGQFLNAAFRGKSK